MPAFNPNGESNRLVAPENADMEANRVRYLGARMLASCYMDTWT
jgi:hypothetical protein